MRVIYMDNNATTRVDEAVVEAMAPFFTELYGNASSMHTFGDRARKPVEKAREQVAALLNCHPTEIIFTSCGTESDNTAIRGTIEARPERRRIVTTRVEHPAVLGPFEHFKKRGYRSIYVGVDDQGLLNMDELDEAINEDTALVSAMWANNETGVLFPVEQIAQKAKAAGAVFHCDAVQAVGKIPIDLQKVPIDLMALSGHKLHAPKGVGVLYIRKGTKLSPLLIGGHQEFGKRAGTENVPYIVGLGKACELAAKFMEDENTRVKALRDRLETALLATCPNSKRNGHKELRLPNTANISFEFVEGEAILLMMDRFGICASSGSACTSGSLEPSHVMRAMGVPFTAAHGSIRFSLSRYNTDGDVDLVIRELPPIIARLREISPFGVSEPAAA